MTGYVVDNVTGLWWQQPIDVANKQNKSCSAGCSQADATTYCTNLTLGGHTDWRLPTRIELASIVDYTVDNPAINGTYFPTTPPDYFWTSAAYVPAPGSAWYVYFSDGSANAGTAAATFRVRCVR